VARMPYLTVIAPGTDGADVVVYKEEVAPIHLDTEHASRQLIERLRWAVQDAEEMARAVPRDRPRRQR
jgi:hypothetical protein